MSSPLSSILAFPIIDRTRRNHGLEHATITLLSQRVRNTSMVGRSTPNGFYLYGDINTDDLRACVDEALARMKGGEHHLAVHPNCGTNFVTAGFMATFAAFIGFIGTRNSRDRFERIPTVAALATLALIFSQPVGLTLQREVTTSGVMGAMEITDITLLKSSSPKTHFVRTQG
jgi:hypothetical protein